MPLFWMLFAANAATPPVTPPASQNARSPNEIIVTGSRVAAPPDKLGASVTVHQRKDSDVAKPLERWDSVKRVAGRHVGEAGGRGGTGWLYMRRAEPNYTLVLVD